MKIYKAIIIDDDLISIKTLEHAVARHCTNIDIVATESNIFNAKQIITKEQPQIIFLDIQYSSSNAFDLLDEIEFSEFEIIFFSAYDSFGFKAFFYNATDYLLKPIVISDLIIAVEKATHNIEKKNIFEKQLLQVDKKILYKNLDYISINSLDKVDIVMKDDIVFLKSDGRYTTLFLKNKSKIVACKNIGKYEQILNSSVFFRIHHSYIINSTHLISVTKKNGLYCNMINDYILPVAKRRYDTLNLFLKLN